MQYRRSGRSGLQLPAISLGLWHNFGARPAVRDRPRDRPPRLRPRHHPLRPREQLRAAVRLGRGELRPDLPRRPAALPRRARDLDEGRLRHVARPVRRVAARASTCSRASTSRSRGWASTTSTSSTRTASTRTRRSRRRWARSTRPCGRARRSTPASPRTRRRRRARRRRSCATSARRSLIHQPSYSMLNRWIEPELLDALEAEGIGCIGFSPLAQGVLTDRYLDGIPEGSRAAPTARALSPRPADRADAREGARAERDRRAAAARRSPQMALAWTLRDPRMTSTLVGALERRAARGERRRARQASTSRTRSWRRSTATRPRATSTSGRASSDSG